MALLVSAASGNWTSASTWKAASSNTSSGTGQYLNSQSSSVAPSAGSLLSSQGFTGSDITIDAVAVKVAGVGTQLGGTLVRLYNVTDAVYVTDAWFALDHTSLPAIPVIAGIAVHGWIVCKFPANVTLSSAKTYRVDILAAVNSEVSFYRDATADNVCRFLRTTTTQAPAAGDDLIVAGEFGNAAIISGTFTTNSTTISGIADFTNVYVGQKLIDPSNVRWNGTQRYTTITAVNAGAGTITTQHNWTAATGSYSVHGCGGVTSLTVTMNETAATDYGSAQTAANSPVIPALAICKGGTLKYGTAASTNYVLRLSGALIVHAGGTFNIGTVADPIPRSSTAVLEFDQLSADGDYGLIIRDGATWTSQGLSRTSGKNVTWALLKGGGYNDTVGFSNVSITSGSPVIQVPAAMTGTVAVGDAIGQSGGLTTLIPADTTVVGYRDNNGVSYGNTTGISFNNYIRMSANAVGSSDTATIFTNGFQGSKRLTVDRDTGWLSGDMIAVASTSATVTECEVGKLTADATSTSDDFTTFKTSMWTSASYPTNPVISSGQLVFTEETTYRAATTTETYRLTGGSVQVAIIPSSISGVDKWQCHLQVLDNLSTKYAKAYIETKGSNQASIVIEKYDGASSTYYEPVSLTYSPTTHKYFRFREASGTLYFDTSPDASTWTNQWSGSNWFTPDVVNFSLVSGNWGTANSPARTVAFDDFSTSQAYTRLPCDGFIAASATLPTSFPPSGTGALTATHDGISFTQAEVINLTRNVVIRSTSSTLMYYIVIGSSTTHSSSLTVDVDWTEFYYLGTTTVGKRGLEVSGIATGSSVTFHYCSFHDTESYTVTFTAYTGGTLDVVHTVFWNCATSSQSTIAIVSSLINTTWNITDCVVVRQLSTNVTISLTDVGGNFSRNRIAGSAGTAINLTEFSRIGVFSDNVVHSCASIGIQFAAAPWGAITNLLIYYMTTGISGSTNAPPRITYTGCKFFGCSSSGVDVIGPNDKFVNCAFGGTPRIGSSTGYTLRAVGEATFEECAFGDTANTYGGRVVANSTAAIGFSGFPYFIAMFYRCTFGGTIVSLSAVWQEGSKVVLHNANLTEGDDRTYGPGGLVQRDATIYRTAAPSERMTAYRRATINITTTSGTNVGGVTAASNFDALRLNDLLYAATNLTTVSRITDIDYNNLTFTLSNNASGTGTSTVNIYSPHKSGSKFIPVNSGESIQVNVYARQSAAGDGTAYVGTKPRLMLKRNSILGITSDIELAVATGGTGSWELLSGTTPAAAADGVFEVYVETGGAAGASLGTGWVNVDDWSIASAHEIYVDATSGLNGNNGLTSGAPKQTLAAAISAAQVGTTIYLKRGETWSEDFWITKTYVKIKPYGSGANPIINGSSGSRSGIIVQAAGVTIENVDTTGCSNGIYVTGATASASITGGVHSGNGTGIVAGGGGRLILVSGSTCQNATVSYGAGDGIQISQDASSGTHTLTNVTCTGNAKAGINHKVGYCVVSGATLTGNGEPGYLVQNDANTFTISDSQIEGNNTANNGTFNVAIENTAAVISRRNLYKDPVGGTGGTNNVNMTGATSFTSEADVFVTSAAITNFGAHIRNNTGTNAALISLTNCSFYLVGGSGACVDCYGATGMKSLTIKNCAFHATAQRNVRVPDAVPLFMNHNNWYRADANEFFEIQDTRYYFSLANIQTNESTDANSKLGDPSYTAPTSSTPNMTPQAGSPLLAAGGSYGVTTGYGGDTFGLQPNIGAVA